jgi:hypothetical protein
MTIEIGDRIKTTATLAYRGPRNQAKIVRPGAKGRVVATDGAKGEGTFSIVVETSTGSRTIEGVHPSQVVKRP